MPADDTRDDLPPVKTRRWGTVLAVLFFAALVAVLFWAAIMLLTGPSI